MVIELIGQNKMLGKEIDFYGDWGFPLFLAKDIAEWIGHSNQRMMVLNADEIDRVTRKCEVKIAYGTSKSKQARDTQEMLFLTENGLYEVLMHSRKGIAKKLKDEIKKYLKTIRVTGGVVEEGNEMKFLDTYFPGLRDETKLAMVKDIMKVNDDMKPKANYFDKVLDTNHCFTVNDIATDFGVSAQALNKALASLDIQYKQSGRWHLYVEYKDLGLAENRTSCIEVKGVKNTAHSLVWTEKGRHFIHELLSKNPGALSDTKKAVKK